MRPSALFALATLAIGAGCDASLGAHDLDLPIVLDGVVTGTVSLRVEDVAAP